jgi:transketolase
MYVQKLRALQKIPKKTAIQAEKHPAALRDLKMAAITMRRRILYMGHTNNIRLHYGALMSMVEIVTALFVHWLNLRPEEPQWPQRDRFVLSKGHGAPSMYVALWMLGFFDETHFDGFRRMGSILQGHPDRLKTPGVDSCSGSLGQGFPVACGMAMGAKIDSAPYHVYTLLSDAECNEGSIWEAAQIASNQGLVHLKAIMDWNGKSSYGWMAGRNDIEPVLDKWRAFNWAVFECDGHDFVSLTQALAAAEQVHDKPAIVLCHTVKGKGIPYVENYPVKPNILLTQDKYEECLAHLEELEKSVSND